MDTPKLSIFEAASENVIEGSQEDAKKRLRLVHDGAERDVTPDILRER